MIYLTYIYISISVSVFDLTHFPNASILDFYFAKVPQPGNTESTGTSPIAQKVSRKPKSQIAVSWKLFRQLLALCPPLGSGIPCT